MVEGPAVVPHSHLGNLTECHITSTEKDGKEATIPQRRRYDIDQHVEDSPLQTFELHSEMTINY